MTTKAKRITEAELESAAKHFKDRRIAGGFKTWFSVEYYNGWAHLHEVDAETEARHCSLRKVAGGTKREMLQYIHAANY